MIRENWRLIMLALFLLLSGAALFIPGVGLTEAPDTGEVDAGPAEEPIVAVQHNLRFGLDLSGGTRIRAPLTGWLATGVETGEQAPNETIRRIANNIDGVTIGDVALRGVTETRQQPVIEIRANVSRATFETALDAAGVEYSSIQQGVSSETRSQTVSIIRDKINTAGLSGATVQTTFNPGEQRWYVKIEVPNQNRSTVIDLVNSRGSVTVQAYHPTEENGSTVFVNRTVLTQDDFQQIGIAQRNQELGTHVPVSVKPAEAERFQRDMVETGVAAQGGTECGWPGAREGTYAGSKGPCLLTVVDGTVVYSAGMSPDLARSMRSGSWAQNPQFVLQTRNMSEAEDLSINLRAGALPARLNIDAGTTSFVAPSLAENFKTFSLITGIIAVLAVAVVVFIRYRAIRVSAPMVLTALSEVVILLGIFGAGGFPLELPHVAGFIAVIGTGVDDLIIIADEVMAEGSVRSDRVFQNRFRKAFWIIGAAAGTTIIAMTPLATPWLSLGDLQGFAIVTILGVLIGVLITRPAYGDILRKLQTDR